MGHECEIQPLSVLVQAVQGCVLHGRSKKRHAMPSSAQRDAALRGLRQAHGNALRDAIRAELRDAGQETSRLRVEAMLKQRLVTMYQESQSQPPLQQPDAVQQPHDQQLGGASTGTQRDQAVREYLAAHKRRIDSDVRAQHPGMAYALHVGELRKRARSEFTALDADEQMFYIMAPTRPHFDILNRSSNGRWAKRDEASWDAVAGPAHLGDGLAHSDEAAQMSPDDAEDCSTGDSGEEGPASEGDDGAQGRRTWSQLRGHRVSGGGKKERRLNRRQSGVALVGVALQTCGRF